MENKVTERDILTAIVNGTEDDLDPQVLVDWAEKKLAQLDAKAAKQRARAAEKRAEGDILTDQIMDVMTDEFLSIAEVADLVRGDDESITVAKVQYRLNKAFKDGLLEKGEKQSETDGRKRKVTAYRLANDCATCGV